MHTQAWPGHDLIGLPAEEIPSQQQSMRRLRHCGHHSEEELSQGTPQREVKSERGLTCAGMSLSSMLSV